MSNILQRDGLALDYRIKSVQSSGIENSGYVARKGK